MVQKLPRMAIGTLAAALLMISFSTVEVSSQTDRRRPKPKATPRSTPVPVSTEPAVISRADDYPTVVIEPPTDGNSNSDPAGSTAASPETIEDLRERLLRLESKKNDPDEKQRRLALNLDILTKAEQRADGLRRQLFEMIEKENSIRGRMDQIDNDMRPETIERQLSSVGSLRPEELRAQRRRSLELEKQNLQTLLTEVQKNRSNLELNLGRAESLVERLRVRVEKEIDSALADEPAADPTAKP